MVDRRPRAAALCSARNEALAASYVIASVHSRNSDFSIATEWGRRVNVVHHHWATKGALVLASAVHTIIVLGECRSHLTIGSGEQANNGLVDVGSAAAQQQCSRALNLESSTGERALFTWNMKPSAATLIELLCLVVYVLDIALAYGSHVGACRAARRAERAREERRRQHRVDGGQRKDAACVAWLRRMRPQAQATGLGFVHVRLALVLLLGADLFTHIASSYTSVRFARSLRPFVAAFRLRHVRSLLATLLRAWRLASIFLTLIVIEACVFGFVLVVLLSGNDFDGDDPESAAAMGVSHIIYICV